MNVIPQRSDHPVVIKWHVTEACNFECGYCYAKWERRPNETDIIRDEDATRALLEALYDRFQSRLAPPRLNFAGGEPLLHPQRLLSAVRLARSIGFDVSLISNGSRLNSRLISDLVPELSMLGLSIDAVRPETLAAIGRQDRAGRIISVAGLARLMTQARRVNPTLDLKINTVVCAPNWMEDLTPMIREFAPQRWKVLRMLPVVSDELAVTVSQFRAFLDRHCSLADLMSIEDTDAMTSSYVMVDPSGRFFQNRVDARGYDYSLPILDVGARQAFAQIGWSPVKFQTRYDRSQVESP
jgi:radical S-adenosyl methionine domain-containing protein 2